MHIIWFRRAVCATEHWRGEGGRPHSPRRSQLKNAPHHAAFSKVQPSQIPGSQLSSPQPLLHSEVGTPCIQTCHGQNKRSMLLENLTAGRSEGGVLGRIQSCSSSSSSSTIDVQVLCVHTVATIAEPRQHRKANDSETRRLPYSSGLLLNNCRNRNSASSESPSNV